MDDVLVVIEPAIETTVTTLESGVVEVMQAPVTLEIVEISRPATVDPGSIPYAHAQMPGVSDLKGALDYLALAGGGSGTTALAVALTGGFLAEKGSTVTSVALSWTSSVALTAQSLDHGIGVLDPELRTYAASGLVLTSSTTYTLTAVSGARSTTASTSVTFAQKRYVGVSSNSMPDDTELRAMTSSWATGRAHSATLDATGGRYLIVAYPAALGPASFKVGGLSFSDMVETIRPVTNASGYTESYRIYRSGRLQNGSAIPLEVL